MRTVSGWLLIAARAASGLATANWPASTAPSAEPNASSVAGLSREDELFDAGRRRVGAHVVIGQRQRSRRARRHVDHVVDALIHLVLNVGAARPHGDLVGDGLGAPPFVIGDKDNRTVLV